MARLQRFLDDESGATAIEYGLIISIMSLAIIGGGNTVWTAIREKFTFLADTVKKG